MRGVILAGGLGTRLAPMTNAINKHLLPLAGEPMVFHGLRQLRSAGIREVLLVCGAADLGQFAQTLGSGQSLELELSYRAQDQPGGIAQALGLAEDFVGSSEFVALLGDNVFGASLESFMTRSFDPGKRARILVHAVRDPHAFGVAELDADERQVVSIEEKPSRPKSNLAVVGAYRYGPDVFSRIRRLQPSARGELEVSDLNATYLDAGELEFERFTGAWVDAGTRDSYRRAQEISREYMNRPS